MENYNKKQIQEDLKIVVAIQNGDMTAFNLLYKSKYKLIKTLIIRKGGKEEDVKDIYQEAFIAFIKNIKKRSFTLTSTLNTYLFSIANNLWLKEINKRSRRKESALTEKQFNLIGDHQEESESEEVIMKQEIMTEVISELKDPCKTLLYNFYFYKKSMEEIAIEMNYKHAKAARNQKYKCMERLRKLVKKKLEERKIANFQNGLKRQRSSR